MLSDQLGCKMSASHQDRDLGRGRGVGLDNDTRSFGLSKSGDGGPSGSMVDTQVERN